MTTVNTHQPATWQDFAPPVVGALGLTAVGWQVATAGGAREFVKQDREVLNTVRPTLPKDVNVARPGGETAAVRAAYEGRSAGMALYYEEGRYATDPRSTFVARVHDGRAELANDALAIARANRPHSAAVAIEHEGWHYPASLDRPLGHEVTFRGGPGSSIVDPSVLTPANPHIAAVRSERGADVELGPLVAQRDRFIEDGSVDGRSERKLTYFPLTKHVSTENALTGTTLDDLTRAADRDLVAATRAMRRGVIGSALGVAALGGVAVLAAPWIARNYGDTGAK